MSEPLTRVDSAVEGLSTSPTTKTHPEIKVPESVDKLDSGVADLSIKDKAAHRRASSSVAGVASMKELKESKTEIELAKETQGTGWKINTSPLSVEDRDVLKKLLITPAVRAIDLHFEHGVVVTARNRHGVTIKDAMDAIFKPNKKRADDELDKPYLKGFEWLPNHPQLKDDPEKAEEREKEWDRLYIHLSSTPGVSSSGGKKKKNKNAEQ
ncbi:hypothetical protein F4775DRAFT_588899 [Biscogniauxia sp. FL1348]|nr:hypothetical protein F4775DRAFT_588899 [Biscogniauxia sp. FL1348]